MKFTVLFVILISYPLIERLTDIVVRVITNKIRKEVKN